MKTLTARINRKFEKERGIIPENDSTFLDNFVLKI